LSYDLAVFDVSAAPRNAPDFTKWYEVQTDWFEVQAGASRLALVAFYSDLIFRSTFCRRRVLKPALRAWFIDMLREFPDMNDRSARTDDDPDNPRLSSYGVSRSLIYVGFAWSITTEAHEACYRLAAKHGVGFIDVSGDEGDVWFPAGEAGLVRRFSLLPGDD
jgi:hypothetical protein